MYENFLCASSNYGDFLNINVGARQIALAGGFTGVADDIFAMEYNPAGTALSNKNEFAFSHTEYLGGANFEYIAYKGKTKYNINYGSSIRLFSINDVERNLSGIKIGDFTNKNILINLNSSKKYKTFYFGFNLKYLSEKIYNKSFTSLLYDAGILFDLITDNENKFIRFGAAIVNVGTDKKYGAYSFSAPSKLKVACSYNTLLFNKDLIMAFELQAERNTDLSKIIGFEYYFKPFIIIRTGININDDYSEFSNFNFGFGVKQKFGIINYAFQSYNELGNTHTITFQIEY